MGRARIRHVVQVRRNSSGTPAPLSRIPTPSAPASAFAHRAAAPAARTASRRGRRPAARAPPRSPPAPASREACEVAGHEAADHQVGFLGAAMVGAEQQAAAPRIEFRHLLGHVAWHGGWHIGRHGNPVSPKRLRVTPPPDLFSGDGGRGATPVRTPPPRTRAGLRGFPGGCRAVRPAGHPARHRPGAGQAPARGGRAATACSTCSSTCPNATPAAFAVSSPADAPEDQEVVLRALVLSLRAARAKTGRPYAEIRAESAGTRLLLRYINGRVDWLSRQMPPGTERVFAGKVKAEGAAYSMLNPLSAPVAVGSAVAGADLAPGEGPAALPGGARRWQRRSNACPTSRNGRTRTCSAARTGPASPPRFGWCRRPPPSRRRQAPTPASPMTRCSPSRSPSPWSAAAPGNAPAAASSATTACGNGRSPPSAIRSHAARQQALAEIDADMAAPHRMLRLLQGDVGSGKTLVAALAMLRAVEAGAQAALMAPTEVLARQHLRTLTPLCLPAGVRLEFLAGSVKGAAAPPRAGRPGRGLDQHRRRHPRPVPGRRPLPRPRPRRGGRAAPLRRGAAPPAGRQGRIGRRRRERRDRGPPPTCW